MNLIGMTALNAKPGTDPDGTGYPVQDLSNVVILNRSAGLLDAPVVTLIDGKTSPWKSPRHPSP